MCRSSSLFSFFLHVYRAKKYIEHHVFLQTSLHSEVQIFTQLEFACAFLLLLTEELYRVHIPFLLSLCMPCRGSESTRLLLQFASTFKMGEYTLCAQFVGTLGCVFCERSLFAPAPERLHNLYEPASCISCSMLSAVSAFTGIYRSCRFM